MVTRTIYHINVSYPWSVSLAFHKITVKILLFIICQSTYCWRSTFQCQKHTISKSLSQVNKNIFSLSPNIFLTHHCHRFRLLVIKLLSAWRCRVHFRLQCLTPPLPVPVSFCCIVGKWHAERNVHSTRLQLEISYVWAT